MKHRIYAKKGGGIEIIYSERVMPGYICDAPKNICCGEEYLVQIRQKPNPMDKTKTINYAVKLKKGG